MVNILSCINILNTHTKARLYSDCEHESGFYTGRVEAVDIEKHCYWVTFDRPGLGKHPIPDTEIRVSCTFYYSQNIIWTYRMTYLESKVTTWCTHAQCSSIPHTSCLHNLSLTNHINVLKQQIAPLWSQSGMYHRIGNIICNHKIYVNYIQNALIETHGVTIIYC